MATDMAQLNVRIPQDAHQRLQFISQVEDRSIADLIRDAVDLLLAGYGDDPDFQARRAEWLEAVAGSWGRD